MLTTRYTFYGTIASQPAGPAPSVQAPSAPRDSVSAGRAETAASASPKAPDSGSAGDDEAALQTRYFEEMIHSAADLLLRTQIPGAVGRFDL